MKKNAKSTAVTTKKATKGTAKGKTKATVRTTPTAPKKDLYTEITEKVLAALANGVLPWARCYGVTEDGQREMPQNYKTKVPYTGINHLLLSLTEFVRPYFMTYKQAEELGGQVKKGAKGTMLVIAKSYNIKKEDDGTISYIPLPYSFLKPFWVFNIADIEGIDFNLPTLKRLEEEAPEEMLNMADQIVTDFSQGPTIVTGLQPSYNPKTDRIKLPEESTFLSRANFIKTRFHELVHATGHETRLKRKGVVEDHAMGTYEYGFEELIAEQGAAMLCQYVGINTATNRLFDNSASYIGGWVKTINADKHAIIKAASAATKAVNYILGKNTTETETEEAQTAEVVEA